MQLRVSFSFSGGEEFSEDFKDLSMLKGFFPNVPTMALTATASPNLLRDLKLKVRDSVKNDCENVVRNLNRVNIYLDKKVLTVFPVLAG